MSSRGVCQTAILDNLLPASRVQNGSREVNPEQRLPSLEDELQADRRPRRDVQELPLINYVSLIHLLSVGAWLGVVMTETLIEVYPYKDRGLYRSTIHFHYWIDLLVELPLVLLLLGSGIVLVFLSSSLDLLHILKIVSGLVPVLACFAGIYVVLRRSAALKAGKKEEDLWDGSRHIVIAVLIGSPFFAISLGLGFWLARGRLLELLAGG